MSSVRMPYFAFRASFRAILGMLLSDCNVSSKQRQHCQLLLVMVALSLCAATLGAIFICLNALWAAIFSFTMLGLCVYGMVHALVKGTTTWTSGLLCWGLSVCALGMHWGLGASSGTFVFHWALLGPQLAVPLGHSRAHATALAIIVCIALLLIQIIPVVCGHRPGPTQTAYPPAFFEPLVALNAIGPFLIGFVTSIWCWGTVKADQESLQATVSTAEMLCKGLVTFDLESLPRPPHQIAAEGSVQIIRMLYDVVNNMRSYRPFLPHHLLAPPPVIDARRGSAVSLAPAEPGSQPGAESNPIVTGSSQNGDAESLLAATIRSRTSSMRAVAPVMPYPVNRRLGTLVYLALSNMDGLLSMEDADANKTAGEIAEMFSEAAVGLVQQWRGIVEFIHGDTMLATWNLLGHSSTHVSNALTAAVHIRDRFAAVQAARAPEPGPAPALALTAGVWAGHVLSGTFGTKDLRVFGVFGCEVSRVAALQRYAAAHSRCIVGNAGVWRLTQEAPQHRLLPVDVIDLAKAVNPLKGSPSTMEILYECLACVSAEDDEWMYQLMSTQAQAQPEHRLHNIFCQLQLGIDSPEALRKIAAKVDQLLATDDEVVRRVCVTIQSLLKQQSAQNVRVRSVWGSISSESPSSRASRIASTVRSSIVHPEDRGLGNRIPASPSWLSTTDSEPGLSVACESSPSHVDSLMCLLK